METLGERVKKRREELGMSINDLSREAGLYASVISRLESGERKGVAYKSIRRLAAALNTSADYLVGVGIEDDDD